MCKNSNVLSNIAESEPLSSTTGNTFLMSGNNGDSALPSRALIQFTLPRIVLISPLCTKKRLGCARAQLGNVFVLKRE